MRLISCFALACVLVPATALADGPVTTVAPGASVSPPASAAPPQALPLSGPSPAEGPPVALGPCGPETVKPDGKLDTAPHGEVSASVGSRGYHQIAGAVCQPIGQDGFVAVSASQTQAPAYRRR